MRPVDGYETGPKGGKQAVTVCGLPAVHGMFSAIRLSPVHPLPDKPS